MSPETCRADLKRLINERLLHLVGYLLCSISTVAPVGSSVGAFYQKLYTVKKGGWVNLSPETCRADFKRLMDKRLLHLVGYLLCSISTVAPVGSSVGAFYQKLYTVKKCS